MEKSRSEYVVKNATITIATQIVKNILGFVSRTVFVKILGAEYLGVNGLFTEILTMLSFTELGIGTAMTFSLYKPLAEGNKDKIKSLMRMYAKAYQIIGVSIAAIGICIIPILEQIVGDVSYVNENLVLLYCLFLFNSVLSYFFVYKKSLIIADQKNYIVEIYQQIFYALQVLVQSVFLIVTRQFIVYLIIVILITFLNNLFIARKANKMYPYLKDKDVEPLDKEEKRNIFTNIKALVVYKMGSIILESTDSIFISSMINVITVGLYSNYRLIINVFKTIGSQVMNSVIASVGNLNASEDSERKEAVFNDMFYINVWFFGFTSVGLCIFLSQLVTVWLGADYIIDGSAVFAAVVYYYVANMHYPCYSYRTTGGLFVFGKYVPIIASVINILLNFILGKLFGLAGILWASTLARVVTYEIIDPILIYKRVFHKNVIRYFTMYLAYGTLIMLDGFICYQIICSVPFTGFSGLIVKAIIVTIVFNAIYFVITFKTKSFKSLVMRVNILLRKKGLIR